MFSVALFLALPVFPSFRLVDTRHADTPLGPILLVLRLECSFDSKPRCHEGTPRYHDAKAPITVPWYERAAAMGDGQTVSHISRTYTGLPTAPAVMPPPLRIPPYPERGECLKASSTASPGLQCRK
ncbi:hypothetical protein HDV63DRAFT_10728 [Trichoderma sp. SZMC 28014]